MSLRSMTGFGRATAQRGGRRATVEVASVNRKQLDIQVNLPRGLQALEPRAQERAGATQTRGRISLQVTLDWTGGGAPARWTLDERLADETLRALRRYGRRAGLRDDLTLGDLLARPELWREHTAAEDVEAAWQVIEPALRRALAGLARMRAAEGRALRRDLETRRRKLEAGLRRIAAHAPETPRRYAAALHRRLADAGFQPVAGDERLIKEIALFADRCDVSEEITRLRSHFEQARKLAGGDEPAGRALDFLTQEMLREINTIGSKSADARITREVVAFKAELERLREQIQNVE